MDWAELTARRDEKYLSVGATYARGLTISSVNSIGIHVTAL